jgi:antitoxin component YwqK of YwqJK toxin-antitoxin module
MNEYEQIREEFFQLQQNHQLNSERFNTVELIRNGQHILELPQGFNGVEKHFRLDGSLICEEEFRNGAAWGCTRYYNKQGRIVGQDYYENGGVIETHIFA